MVKKSFYYLWTTQTISNLADLLYTLALTILVFNNSGSIIVTTLIPFLTVISRLCSGFFAPLLIARYRLPALLGISQAGQFIIFSLLTLYISFWRHDLNLFILLFLVFCLSFLDGWTMPSRNALIPRLVNDTVLMKTNGMVATTDQVVQFAGWAFGGILLSILGPYQVLYITAACYGFAAIVTWFIVDPTVPSRSHIWDIRINSADHERSSPSHWHILQEGWILLWKSKRLRSLLIMDATEQFGGSVWAGSFILVFVLQVLGKSEQWWGYINASYFGGAVLGGIVLIALVKQIEKRIVFSLLFGTLGYVVITALYAINTSAIFALVIMFFTGPMTELAGICRRTLQQRSVDQQILPKVFSAQYTILSLIYGLSLLIMSVVADRFGIASIYLLAALMSGIAVVVGWFHRRQFEQIPFEQLADGRSNTEAPSPF